MEGSSEKKPDIASGEQETRQETVASDEQSSAQDQLNDEPLKEGANPSKDEKKVENDKVENDKQAAKKKKEEEDLANAQKSAQTPKPNTAPTPEKNSKKKDPEKADKSSRIQKFTDDAKVPGDSWAANMTNAFMDTTGAAIDFGLSAAGRKFRSGVYKYTGTKFAYENSGAKWVVDKAKAFGASVANYDVGKGMQGAYEAAKNAPGNIAEGLKSAASSVKERFTGAPENQPGRDAVTHDDVKNDLPAKDEEVDLLKDQPKPSVNDFDDSKLDDFSDEDGVPMVDAKNFSRSLEDEVEDAYDATADDDTESMTDDLDEEDLDEDLDEEGPAQKM